MISLIDNQKPILLYVALARKHLFVEAIRNEAPPPPPPPHTHTHTQNKTKQKQKQNKTNKQTKQTNKQTNIFKPCIRNSDMLSANVLLIIKVVLLIHVTRSFRLTLLYRSFPTWWVQNISRYSADNAVRCVCYSVLHIHYNDVIMSDMSSQITSLTTVYLTVYSRCRSKKHQSSATLAFVRGIHRWPVNSPHKLPITR